MLRVEGLNVFYGAIQALNDVSLTVEPGEVVSIIGSNGAGKSTLLRAISGLLSPRTGSINYTPNGTDHDLLNISPDNIVKLGISQSPEGRRIFTNMTVRENLLLGAHARKGDLADDMEKAMERFPRVKERLKQSAGTMSGGEQQMLAMCRAMMAKPKLLLLDEPSMGLAPNLVMEIFNTIQDLNKDGTTILLVEQNANRALEIADRAYVLETGKIVMSDTGKALLENPDIKKFYLGG